MDKIEISMQESLFQRYSSVQWCFHDPMLYLKLQLLVSQ